MTRYLCISATFLDPWFHGVADERPEWPPSPMRLFQALVRGAAMRSRETEWPETAAAFRWLERREPPLIVAPRTEAASAFVVHVPSNDGDRVFDRQARLTGKPRQPQHLCDSESVHFLWRIEESERAASEQHVKTLCRSARGLVALGWGIDHAIGDGQLLPEEEAMKMRGQRWQPREAREGTARWRVPTEGSFADLERVYESFMKRIEGREFRPFAPMRKFATATYVAGTNRPPRPYAVFELPEGVAFRQVDAAKVAAMLRSATIARAESDDHTFPGGVRTYVAGHTDDRERTPPRFSYLPLPTIGHPHADGMIRRLLIAEPLTGNGDHATWAQARLRSATLRDESGNERGILLDLWRSASHRVLGMYADSARAWLSVTPVVLPGFDDGERSKAHRLLLDALRHAEVPVESVEDVILRKAPFLAGSQHPREYFVPRYLRGRGAWHVRLVFREPIRGPLSLGAGRHAGLGVLACE